jgi:hypothetical protein
MTHAVRIQNYVLIASAILGAAVATGQPYSPNLQLDHPAIGYWTTAAADPVSLLAKGIATPRLDLPHLLKLLRINADSQMLVFSKTSFQASRISPRNPRAIYFNDDVAVGWVRGSDWMEVAAADPRLGVVFYQTDGQKFIRNEACLKCHQGPATQGVPGLFVGSVFPDVSGMPDRTGAIITDHRSAFADRWGGWYVTAARGEQQDRANGVASDPAEPHTLKSRQNLRSLEREFSPAGYLSPVSDIVALMTFEHQTQAMALLTRVGWKARMGKLTETDIEALVRYLTFADEAPLKEPIEGVSTFTQTFAQRGPFDRLIEDLRDRPATLQILLETTPNLPDWCRSAANATGI